jgi:hypothetical protein
MNSERPPQVARSRWFPRFECGIGLMFLLVGGVAGAAVGAWLGLSFGFFAALAGAVVGFAVGAIVVLVVTIATGAGGT